MGFYFLKKEGGGLSHPLFAYLKQVGYTRRVLKMRTRVTITRIAPMAITTQTQTGVGAGFSGVTGAGAPSVWKLKVADQSLAWL